MRTRHILAAVISSVAQYLSVQQVSGVESSSPNCLYAGLQGVWLLHINLGGQAKTKRSNRNGKFNKNTVCLFLSASKQ